jgi:hypothetical protein
MCSILRELLESSLQNRHLITTLYKLVGLRVNVFRDEELSGNEHYCQLIVSMSRRVRMSTDRYY